MQDASERIKRRRLDVNEEEDLSLSQGRMLQAAAAAGADASNQGLTNLILRQRILAEQQQVQQQQQQADAGLASSMAFGRDPSLLAGGGSAGGGDPMVAQLRQNLFSQQLQQAARLQDEMTYLRASEAAAAAQGPSSIYASLLGGGPSGSHSHALGSSFLLEQALGNERRGSAEQLRALQMQQLLEAEREEAAAAAAVAVETSGGGFRHLLGLPGTGDSSQAALLTRIQNERAMAAAAGMGAPGAFPPSGLGLHSLMSSRGAPTGAAMNRDLLLARGGGGPPHPGNYLGLPMPAAAMGGIPRPMQPKKRPAPSNPNVTGRQPIHLFMSCDMEDLSPYQCLVRKQIELFEAQDIDAETNARGRNRPIVVGQVGIRCKHCKMLPPRKRERAAIYYPSKLDRLYQAGQTMASVHLGHYCNHIPEHLRQELARLREGKSAALAGKKYWSDGARALGVIEDDDRLFFKRD